MFVTETDI